ncbi:unnamed protein product [Amoebophrya sp. A120]|nr:unnamed protein product [Amoebophrya sp. A120]|eukprot:GSA120T00001455001.1
MSAYVLSWLNDELQLSAGQVTVIEKQFASGYLFAEVLHRAHPKIVTSDDLAEFLNDKKAKGVTVAGAKKHNAGLLRKTLKKCEFIPYQDDLVEQIMGEDRGTSLRLLYQIRKSLDEPKVHEKPEKIPKLPRTELDASDVYWYNLGGHKEPLLKPFFDEERQQIIHGLELDEQQEAEILHNRDVNRAYLLQKEVERRQEMADDDERVLQFWRNTYRADVRKTAEEVRVEREVLAREQATIDQTRRYYRGQAFNGIDGYERNLQRIGIDTSENAGTDVGTEGIQNMGQLMESMKSRLPTRKNLFLECLAKMRKIKAGGKTRRRAAVEREKRRRKQRVQTAAEAEDLAKTTALKTETDRLTQVMATQQKAARLHYLQRAFEEKETEHRALLQTKTAARRKSESEDRWAAASQIVREEYTGAQAAVRKDHHETFVMMEKDRKAAREYKHASYCDRVLDDLVHIADKIFRHRQAKYQATGELPPPSMPPQDYRVFLEEFVEMGAGPRQPRPDLSSDGDKEPEALPVPPAGPIVSRLGSDAIVRDFFFSQNAWSVSAEQAAALAAAREELPPPEFASVAETITKIFQDDAYDTKLQVRKSVFEKIPEIKLEDPSVGAEGDSAPPAEGEEDPKAVAARYLPAPTREDIEFVLVSGPPLSGKRSVVQALAGDHVFVVDYEQLITGAHAVWLDYKPEKVENPEDEPALPLEISALTEGHAGNTAAFAQMKDELLAALDLPPPKKGEPAPGEGVAKKYLMQTELTQSMFEKLLKTHLATTVDEKCTPYLASACLQKREKMATDLAALQEAQKSAEAELHEIQNPPAPEPAEGEEDEPPQAPEVDQEALAEAEAKVDAAIRAVREWHAKVKRKPRCYIVLAADYYPMDAAETTSLMHNCILPILGCDLAALDSETASSALPKPTDSESRKTKAQRASAVLLPELGLLRDGAMVPPGSPASSSSSGFYSRASSKARQPIATLPCLRKVYLSAGPEVYERPDDPSRLPETFFNTGATAEAEGEGASAATTCSVFPFVRATTHPLIDRVYQAKVALQSAAQSPFTPVAAPASSSSKAPRSKKSGSMMGSSAMLSASASAFPLGASSAAPAGGAPRVPPPSNFQVFRTSTDEGVRPVVDIASDIRNAMLVPETPVLPPVAPASDGTEYEQWGQVALAYEQKCLNLLDSLTGQTQTFFRELEDKKQSFEKFMNLKNENLKQPIREAGRSAVRNDNAAENVSDLLWAEANRRRKDSEEEFTKTYLDDSAWWKSKILDFLLKTAEQFLEAHWLYAIELSGLVAGVSTGDAATAVGPTTFTKTSPPTSKKFLAGGAMQHLPIPGDDNVFALGRLVMNTSPLPGAPSPEGDHPGAVAVPVSEAMRLLDALCHMYSSAAATTSEQISSPIDPGVQPFYLERCHSTLAKFRDLARTIEATTRQTLVEMEGWIAKRVSLENEVINKYMEAIRIRVAAEVEPPAKSKEKKLIEYAVETSILEECTPVPSFAVQPPPGSVPPRTTISSASSAASAASSSSQKSARGGFFPSNSSSTSSSACSSFSGAVIVDKFLSCASSRPAGGAFSNVLINGSSSSSSSSTTPSSFIQKLEAMYLAGCRYEVLDQFPPSLLRFPVDKLSDFARFVPPKWCGSPLVPLLFYNRSLQPDALAKILAACTSATDLLTEDSFAGIGGLWSPPPASPEEGRVLNRLLYGAATGILGMWALLSGADFPPGSASGSGSLCEPVLAVLESGALEFTATQIDDLAYPNPVEQKARDDFKQAAHAANPLLEQAAAGINMAAETTSPAAAAGDHPPSQTTPVAGAGGEMTMLIPPPTVGTGTPENPVVVPVKLSRSVFASATEAQNLALAVTPLLPGDSLVQNFFSFLLVTLPLHQPPPKPVAAPAAAEDGEQAPAAETANEQGELPPVEVEQAAQALDAETFSLHCLLQVVGKMLPPVLAPPAAEPEEEVVTAVAELSSFIEKYFNATSIEEKLAVDETTNDLRLSRELFFAYPAVYPPVAKILAACASRFFRTQPVTWDW